MTQLPIPVHVGSEPLDYWDDIEARQHQLGEEAAPWLQKQRRPAIASATLDWAALGFEPRWVGFDTADCAVALQPSIYSGQGADELNRFRQGAESRGEIALVISLIGDPEEKPRGVLFQHDDSVSIGQSYTSVSSRPIGKGARVRAAEDLGDADGQLALRMLSCNPVPLWRSLSLSVATLEPYNGRVQHPAEGTLVPILETELGEPVVAAWISPDGVERRYVVPVETPWPLLLQWLHEQALPEFVPGAMRRARRQLATDQTLMIRRERVARAALAELEADYVTRRRLLERDLEEAQAEASPVREGLLYGTGKQLVDAVRAVLESAGVDVVDLDEELGGTKNADLLCTYAGCARLVEVKGVSGSAPERAYQDLVRHLREWEKLPGVTPVVGGALILSYQLRVAPQERSRQPYGRPEFLAAQTEPVITTLDLFDAWREEDAKEIRRMLFGPVTEEVAQPLTDDAQPLPAAGQDAPKTGKRRWFRRG
ncbi:hypothetical protein Vqi01_42470 [Micromonospora qiuiae]|uniref:DUF91 domain-containing protein n=1 Tax=Micromonospora qiuiae TaxID=502268 RepID=A0ABQ4JI03_9ACTN|nr:hypothetical protein [Micromonospora qiuiae]GIJ29085.1 hypothetical protein Vqi01_42470 [Micromonospora qiuiae]